MKSVCAIALALAAFGNATVVPCTSIQNNLCRNFQNGNYEYYYCVCTASPSCTIDRANCNYQKYQQCEAFCNTKQAGVYPYPTECSNPLVNGIHTYYCSQFSP